MSATTVESESSGVSSGGQHHHEKPRYDDINVGVIVLIGAISAIVTFLIIAFVQGLTYHWRNSYIMERSWGVENTPVIQIQEEQKRKLLGDQANGVKSIDEAMDIVARQYAQPGEVSAK